MQAWLYCQKSSSYQLVITVLSLHYKDCKALCPVVCTVEGHVVCTVGGPVVCTVEGHAVCTVEGHVVCTVGGHVVCTVQLLESIPSHLSSTLVSCSRNSQCWLDISVDENKIFNEWEVSPVAFLSKWPVFNFGQNCHNKSQIL